MKSKKKESIKFDEIFFADFHIHSRFSRACSKDITIDNLFKWAKIKGLNLLGTGDFTHPLWFKEIKEKLKDNGKGFFTYGDNKDFYFIITGEISLMYRDEIKSRKIHLNLLIPSLEVAEKLHSYFDSKGRRDYDGRPIFNIKGNEFVRDIKNISEDIEIIPAHIWTPWFGVFGSISGFDSLEECFKEQKNKINAIETGISSDPKMNWRIKELTDNNISIVSFSDAHSFWPWRLGREATIFKKTDDYNELISQIRKNDFIGTIETEPSYGKYHWDGHRNCNFSCSPKETKKLNGICPVCKNKLTIGVENRIEKLSKNKEDFVPKNSKIFYKILPLHEIISFALKTSVQSKKVWDIYNYLIKNFKNELNILLRVSKEEFLNVKLNERIIELIIKNRDGKIKIKPGYDGVYGEILLDEMQETLF
jgi:uncharacterized protein (TIGR00375 family)